MDTRLRKFLVEEVRGIIFFLINQISPTNENRSWGVGTIGSIVGEDLALNRDNTPLKETHHEKKQSDIIL